jgi:hypothetical protein
MTAAQIVLFKKRASAAGGSYWVSDLPKPSLRRYLTGLAATRLKTAADTARWWEEDGRLRSYLRGLDPASFAKAASLGGEQEQGFEQAFSSLAYAYLKDKSPRLLDFIVGFQLVDRNEDNTKSMGLFGFKVGEQWLYAPVFFLNGDLKGHELLYIKKQDTFVPMKENWVNYLISRKPHVLGEPSPEDTNQLGGLMPNLTRLTRPPTGSKYGSDGASLPHLDAWAVPAMPLVAALAAKKAAALYPEHKTAADLNFAQVVAQPFRAALAPSAATFDLRAFLTANPVFKEAFEKCYFSYPGVKKAVDRFYGPGLVEEVRRAARAEADDLTKRAASYIVPPKARDRGRRVPVGDRFRRPGSPNLFDDDPPPEKGAGLTVIALDVSGDAPITDNKAELTDAERARLLKDTVLIKDERDPHAVSIAYNTQTRLELTNPQDTGLYEVLEKPGSFDQMLVISNPHTGRGRENFCVVVRKADPRSGSTRTARTCGPSTSSRGRGAAVLRRRPGGVDSLQKGGTYIALHSNGSGTCAVHRPRGLRRRRLQGVVEGPHLLQRPAEEPAADPGVVVLGLRVGLLVLGRQAVHQPPQGVEPAVRQRRADDPRGLQDRQGGGPAQAEAGQGRRPGRDVLPVLRRRRLGEGAHPAGHPGRRPAHAAQAGERRPPARHRGGRGLGGVAVAGQGADDEEGGPRQPGPRPRPARGPGPRDAQGGRGVPPAQPGGDLLRQVRLRLRQLEPPARPRRPGLPRAVHGHEQNGPNSVNAIYPQEEFQPVPAWTPTRPTRRVYDPFYQPDQGAMQSAQQASASGQKEVFDTSMISGMLKAVRQDSLVDRYLGDLMKALDKLGRILFMFYWHQEEFEDRYGKQDLPELEDSLRNAFEVLGDVCLFLKEKTVQGGQGMDLGAGVGNQSEPSREELTMSVPYEMPPRGGLEVNGGDTGCFELPFASRAHISKIVIVQTAGTAVAFTAALFNHENACQRESASDSVGAETGPLPADLYRVTPDLPSDTAGNLQYFSDRAPGGHAFPFVGMDRDRLGRSRKIYLRITPQGSGLKTFAVAIAGETFGGE